MFQPRVIARGRNSVACSDWPESCSMRFRSAIEIFAQSSFGFQQPCIGRPDSLSHGSECAFFYSTVFTFLNALHASGDLFGFCCEPTSFVRCYVGNPGACLLNPLRQTSITHHEFVKCLPNL